MLYTSHYNFLQYFVQNVESRTKLSSCYTIAFRPPAKALTHPTNIFVLIICAEVYGVVSFIYKVHILVTCRSCYKSQFFIITAFSHIFFFLFYISLKIQICLNANFTLCIHLQITDTSRAKSKQQWTQNV